MDAHLELLKLNNKIPLAEKNKDVSCLDTIFDQGLIFKRADGSIADKPTYLASVQNEANTVEGIEQIITSTEFNKRGDIGIVNSIVKFHGVRSGKAVHCSIHLMLFIQNVITICISIVMEQIPGKACHRAVTAGETTWDFENEVNKDITPVAPR